MTIQETQNRVDVWINEIGQRYFNELTNMAVLTEEVGELARLFARVYGEQSFKVPMTKEEIKAKLGEEMADVLFVLICLANQTGIDLTAEFEKSLKKKTQRDKARHANNEKLK
ncbi:MAG: nucleotide pyrophosphohydrolase [Saprospiraceae bacterium]|nr:nucleotide pyrophosphohydrolase [Saprospiraceae bacterium]